MTTAAITKRQQSYRTRFPNPRQDPILKDLCWYCRANWTTYDPDPRIHARLEGRRDVWLRIQRHLNLSPEDLFAIYGGVMHKENE